MDVLSLARRCGMQVTLDARIGHEEYRSVHGSVEALERFADALFAEMRRDGSAYRMAAACEMPIVGRA
ncbi:hypothetical protein [Burkholderia sp. MSMB1826]|uniref:hypothetical protein n=1 Tax=Burkholderia sp. MSMB1826 TaxID=1637875 RepID=UPI000753E2D4|nr:hypothetical protein [Burkholderia sp. MSMB1826]KVL19514.1 hypothetical protein WS95_13680 [Burkholderia sp. MSMB1826]